MLNEHEMPLQYVQDRVHMTPPSPHGGASCPGMPSTDHNVKSESSQVWVKLQPDSNVVWQLIDLNEIVATRITSKHFTCFKIVSVLSERN